MDSMIKIGAPAPKFSLVSLDGTVKDLSAMLGTIVVLNFWSAECPWSKRGDDELLQYLHEWRGKVELWVIASNLNEPEEDIRETAKNRKLPVVLLDEDAKIADLYDAQTTPHCFVIDQKGLLRYQGALNDTSFRNPIPSEFYLRDAVNALLNGNDPPITETPPYGCAIVRYSI